MDKVYVLWDRYYLVSRLQRDRPLMIPNNLMPQVPVVLGLHRQQYRVDPSFLLVLSLLTKLVWLIKDRQGYPPIGIPAAILDNVPQISKCPKRTRYDLRLSPDRGTRKAR